MKRANPYVFLLALGATMLLACGEPTNNGSKQPPESARGAGEPPSPTTGILTNTARPESPRPRPLESALRVKSVLEDPKSWDGKAVEIAAYVTAGSLDCSSRACTTSNPCCNDCKATLTLRDDKRDLPRDSLFIAKDGTTLACRGDNCSWNSKCDIAPGPWRLTGVVRAADEGPLLEIHKAVDLKRTDTPRAPAAAAAIEDIACDTNEECLVVTAPQCNRAGCSPPCGVFETGVVAVNARRVDTYRKRAEEAATERCRGVVCERCQGALPEIPVERYRAQCVKGFCEITEAPPAPGAAADQEADSLRGR